MVPTQHRGRRCPVGSPAPGCFRTV